MRILKIAGYDPCPETDTARRFNEEDREIPAGSPAAIQSLGRRLGALVLPALIADPSETPALRSLSRASVSVGLPPTNARAQPVTALPGPGIAGSSMRRGRSTHRRNIGTGRKWRRRR